MPTPILFVDEKFDKEISDFRYKILERHLSEFTDLIEFTSELKLEKELDSFGELKYTPNDAFDGRRLVFIHTSFDDPEYPEPIIDKAKLFHQETIFAKFSKSREYIPHLNNIQFSRAEQIYNLDRNGFYYFLSFYRRYGWFEFDLIAKNRKQLLERENDGIEYALNLKDDASQEFNLAKLTNKKDFKSLLRIALNDSARIEKAMEYSANLKSPQEWSKMIDLLVKEIQKKMSTYRKFNQE
jgi:hypothetical protein